MIEVLDPTDSQWTAGDRAVDLAVDIKDAMKDKLPGAGIRMDISVIAPQPINEIPTDGKEPE